ncbi:MAG: hypothetical protein ACOVSI_04010 [Gemmatimonas sp.]
MMLDRHESHDNLNPKARDSRDAAVPAVRPMADREVPLPGVSAADATTADVIQLWLDGDATEAVARQENNTAVEFWMRVGTDVEPMRHAKAPAQLVANVMAAIPVKEPSAIKQAPLAD